APARRQPHRFAPCGMRNEDIMTEKCSETLRQEVIDQPEGAERNGTGPGEAQNLAERFDPLCSARQTAILRSSRIPNASTSIGPVPGTPAPSGMERPIAWVRRWPA